jgi:hypothetical protein
LSALLPIPNKIIIKYSSFRLLSFDNIFDDIPLLCKMVMLITSLRTAVDIDGTLDKEATSYDDIFDAFRLALKFYHYEEIT